MDYDIEISSPATVYLFNFWNMSILIKYVEK